MSTPTARLLSLLSAGNGDDADSMALRFAWMTATRLIFLFWDFLD